MNRVLFAWMASAGIPAVVFGLMLGGARVAAAATDAAGADGLGGPSPSSTSSGSSSSSGSQCISDQAKKTLDICPEGPAIQSVPHGKAPAMSFHSKVEDIKKGDKTNGIGTADISMIGVRDARQSALKQRALALLVTEIQQLESLLKATENTSNDRPKLLRRLAEDYVELENAAFREKTEAEVKRDGFKTSNPRQAQAQQSIATSRKTTMERSRKAAIRYYSLLVDDDPAEPAAGVPGPRRGLLLPRVRVRAVGRHGQRAPRLPRPHHEDAELQ